MLKVLIADDEKKVCQLIANIVDWKSLGYEIVGTANDGITAYNYIKDHEIDVLMVDIRMPECSGLELIKKLRELEKKIHIVIISGYGQFEYVQTALHLGVEEYLLKPVRKKDVIAILEKISDKHKKETEKNQQWEDMKQELDRNKERIKNTFLIEVLKHPEKYGGFYSVDKINKEYHSHFKDIGYRAFQIRIILENKGDSCTVRKIILNRMMKLLQKELPQDINESVINIIDNDIYGLINGTEEQLEKAYTCLKKIKMEVVQLQNMFGKIYIYIALGMLKSQMQNIMETIEEARIALTDRFYYSNHLILKYRPDRKREDMQNLINNTFKRRFWGCIEILDLESLKKEISIITVKLEKNENKDGLFVEEVYKEILQLFFLGVSNYGIEISDKYHVMKDEILDCATISEGMNLLSEYMETEIRVWMQEKKNTENKPIRIAKKYIAENYFKPLTLEIVSKETGFNSTYFSSVFKKEVGVNFSEYLMKIRIDNAKNMLLNTNQSVEDISYAVGYSDIKYFSRLFKKHMGVTPTEFRKLYN